MSFPFRRAPPCASKRYGLLFVARTYVVARQQRTSVISASHAPCDGPSAIFLYINTRNMFLKFLVFF